MNALDLLRQDHPAIDALFEKYRTATGLWRKEGIAIELVKALSHHIEVEEVVVVPALKKSPSLQEQVHKFLEAQNLIKAVIKGVGPPAQTPQDARSRERRLDAKVRALLQRYSPVAQLEETELFPNLQATLGRKELDRLGTQLELQVRGTTPAAPSPRQRGK